jgi:hypothetical protein
MLQAPFQFISATLLFNKLATDAKIRVVETRKMPPEPYFLTCRRRRRISREFIQLRRRLLDFAATTITAKDRILSLPKAV